MTSRVLIVDDERPMCEMLAADLKLRDYEVEWCLRADEALEKVRQQPFHAVLTDLRMPEITGTELCRSIVEHRPQTPVIVMTAFGSLEAAVDAIRAGAYDFITKPIELDMLALTLERAVRHCNLQETVERLNQELELSREFGELIGSSPPMHGLFDQMSRVADTETTILVTGESGTGKELVARAIHDRSRRKEGPFVGVNCAALPDNLIESEMFGHAAGAFTDARGERKGLFLEAQGGTLFLDEIGDFPLAMQAKLLRALEAQRIRPVGSDQEVPFDVRIVSATNRDLETAVEEQRFREDLYFRINVIQLELPPLRARGTDILLLAQHYVERFAKRMTKEVTGLSEPVAGKFLSYSWPGNIRELRNVVERAVALTQYEKITLDDLPDKVRDYRSNEVRIGGDDPTELVPLEEVERRYIHHVLQSTGNNKTMAARILGLDRKTLYRKLKEEEESG